MGAENPIPEEVDHREIAVSVSVMNEMQFLPASEPCKSLKPRSLHVVFPVEQDVRAKRYRTRDYLDHEEIKRQQEIGACSYKKYGNEKERRVVAVVTELRPRDEMIFGIVSVMKRYVITEKSTSDWMVAEFVMHQRLQK